MFIREERQSKERGKELSVFSQMIAPLILTSISCWLPPNPPKVFSKPSSYFLLLFTCFRSLLTLQTHPWKCFPFVKTSDLKQQQTAWHLLIHQHFCCCFINDSGWNSDLLGCLMAEPHGKWIDNDLGKQRHPSDQERTHWFDGSDLNQKDGFLRSLHFWGSAGEEGLKLTAVLSRDSWGFHAQRWEKKRILWAPKICEVQNSFFWRVGMKISRRLSMYRFSFSFKQNILRSCFGGWQIFLLRVKPKLKMKCKFFSSSQVKEVIWSGNLPLCCPSPRFSKEWKWQALPPSPSSSLRQGVNLWNEGFPSENGVMTSRSLLSSFLQPWGE